MRWAGARGNKFGARKTPCAAGHTHASKREAVRCGELRLLEKAGEISHLEHQPQYWFTIEGRQIVHENGRRVGYTADFTYRTPAGQQIVEDSKGAYRDRAWTLRKAIFRALYPHIELREV